MITKLFMIIRENATSIVIINNNKRKGYEGTCSTSVTGLLLEVYSIFHENLVFCWKPTCSHCFDGNYILLCWNTLDLI